MAETMIASEMTDGQIEEFCNKLRSALRKHRLEVSSEVAQQINGIENIGMELYAPIRARAEQMSKMIIRRVKVDRSRTPRQALEATGCKIYHCDDAVLATAPGSQTEEVDMYFFDLDYDPTTVQLAAEYDARNLKPDFAAQAAVNEADPAFADERPNGLQWDLNENGVASYAAFYRWDGGRGAGVYRLGSRWCRAYRFGGVRK